MKRFMILVVSLLTFLGLYSCGGDSSSSTLKPQLAPLSEAFVKYRENVVSQSFKNFGYIPPPVDLGKYQLPSTMKIQDVLPSSYDLRQIGKVSPVKDQGNCGACWTFATYGSMESNLLPDELWDFSENHLKNSHGFDIDACRGGNGIMSTAYLARWNGPIKESDDPYDPNSFVSPSGLLPVKHVQNVIYLPNGDKESIKSAIKNYGAVMTAMYYDDTYYNSTNYSYYYNGSATPNHAVTIVGWDDNYDKNKFKNTPPSNGAWIVKNSWGDKWGDKGYFYVSYYDTAFLVYNFVFLKPESISNYDKIYQYDDLGLTYQLGFSSPTAYMANIFSTSGQETLKAVSFYAVAPGIEYEVSIYSNLSDSYNPKSGNLVAKKFGKFIYAGYYTVNLDNPVQISGKFSVIVKLTASLSNTNFPIPIENPISNYSSKAVASYGQSFVSPDGNNWGDLTIYYPNANVCIKAFTSVQKVFSDVDSSYWAYNYIIWLKNKNITTGFPDGTFRPYNFVTREQMAAFLMRAKYGESFSFNPASYFNDVTPDRWSFKYIQKLREDGITTGCGNNNYCPDSYVTRAQMAVFLVRSKVGDTFSYNSIPYFNDVPPTHWAFKYIQKLKELGITTGYPDGSFKPDSNVNRGEMSAFLYRTFGP